MTTPDQSAPVAKVALVTGAAGIIGPEIVRILRMAGWKVAAADHRAEDFSFYRRLHGMELEADLRLTGDLADRRECLRLVAETTERLGPMGLLVNGATANSKSCNLADLEAAFVERFFQVDLMAPLYLSQAAASAGLAKMRGLIVNLSSVRVEEVLPGNLLYTVAKAGMEKMTEALAVELAPLGVRVNAIRLGSVPGNAFLRPALGLLPDDLAAQLRADVLSRHYAHCAEYSLTGRVGLGADVGNMIAYLASPAGEFVNGAVIPLDGGFLLSASTRVSSTEKGPSISARWMADPRGELKKWLKEKGIDHEI